MFDFRAAAADFNLHNDFQTILDDIQGKIVRNREAITQPQFPTLVYLYQISYILWSFSYIFFFARSTRFADWQNVTQRIRRTSRILFLSTNDFFR